MSEQFEEMAEHYRMVWREARADSERLRAEVEQRQEKVDRLANLLHAEGVCENHGREFIPECSGCCAAAATGKYEDQVAALRAERDDLRERMNQIAQWQRPKPHWPADCACELCSPNSAWNVLNPVAERDAAVQRAEAFEEMAHKATRRAERAEAALQEGF